MSDVMILTMTKYHENLSRDSALSLLFMVKFFSSSVTKMILKLPNETFLRITRYCFCFVLFLFFIAKYCFRALLVYGLFPTPQPPFLVSLTRDVASSNRFFKRSSLRRRHYGQILYEIDA